MTKGKNACCSPAGAAASGCRVDSLITVEEFIGMVREVLGPLMGEVFKKG